VPVVSAARRVVAVAVAATAMAVPAVVMGERERVVVGEACAGFLEHAAKSGPDDKWKGKRCWRPEDGGGWTNPASRRRGASRGEHSRSDW